MRVSRPSRGEAAAAVGCAAWDAFFLAGEGLPLVATVPLTASAALVSRRRPLAAAAVLAGALLVQTALGLPSDDPAGLAAVVVVVYALGRHRGSWTSVVGAGSVGAALLVADPTVPSAVFVTILAGTLWTFGWLVRRRTLGAARAADAAAQLAATDPEALAARVVAEERARLAGEALGTIRRAVTAMVADAERATPDLRADVLRAIQARGREATSELRRLLGLLRSESAEPGPVADPPPVRVWRVDVCTAAAIAALHVLEFTVSDAAGARPFWLLALGVGFATTLALRRTDPVLGGLLAALAPAGALAAGRPLTYGLATAAVFALFAWSMAGEGTPRAYGALAVLAMVLIADVHRDEPGNVAMTVALLAASGVAGHLWRSRDREERAATAAAAELRAQHAAVTEAAVRAERLRLARELHDVASHGVAVMVLQAGAAEALAERAPAQAREALRVVRAAGADALVELEVLFDLLDAGAVGAAGLAAPEGHRDLADALRALTDRIEGAGMRVVLDLPDELPDERTVAAATYRVVQEALTNATRYAPAATVRVRIIHLADGIEVAVEDDGSGGATDGDHPRGFGLVGLTERITALGGTVTAGPRAAGGFAVTAQLPISPPAGVEA